MRTWTRAAMDCRCGKCGASIRRGIPYMELTAGGANWRLKRCQVCTAEKPPADLPDLPDQGLEDLKLTP